MIRWNYDRITSFMSQTNDTQYNFVLPPFIQEELKRMSRYVAMGTEEHKRVAESFKRSGIPEMIEEAAKKAQKHKKMIEDWQRALTGSNLAVTKATLAATPLVTSVEKATSKTETAVAEKDKMEIVDMLVERLRTEFGLLPIRAHDSQMALFLEGQVIYRQCDGRPLRCELSVSRKKLLRALTDRPQDREVLRVLAGSKNREAFYKLIESLNKRLSKQLKLPEKVIISEGG